MNVTEKDARQAEIKIANLYFTSEFEFFLEIAE